MIKTENFIFGTSTSRSGSSLVANLLSANKNIIITKDLIHFFRFIYNRYNPIADSKNQLRLVKELCLRLKYRKRINIPYHKIFNHFNKVNDYSDVLNSLNSFLLNEIPGKKIIGESANTEWRNIGNLLNLNKNYKAYQVIRDPRSILSSFKKLTYSEGYDYLDIIFFWVDAINYKLKYEKEYSSNRFITVKFEEIHKSPEISAKKLCQFANVDYDENMLNVDSWPLLINTKYNYVNISAYSKKKVFGFSESRISEWKNNLKEWEIVLVQYLLKDYLKMLGYELVECNQKLLKKGLEILENSKTLKKNFLNFKKDNSGTNARSSDPTKPENWAATDLSKNQKAKFIDTVDYENYIKELNEI